MLLRSEELLEDLKEVTKDKGLKWIRMVEEIHLDSAEVPLYLYLLKEEDRDIVSKEAARVRYFRIMNAL